MENIPIWKRFRANFFAGLFVVSPVAVSIWILWWAFNVVSNLLLPEAWRQNVGYRVAAIVMAVVIVTLIGMVTRHVIGRRLLHYGETLLTRIPLLNRVYGFMKQVSTTLWSDKKTMFQKVVLVQFPRLGTFAIGFVTSETQGEPQAKTNETVVNIFVPTTPNPTSGFMILVPREQLIWLEMSVADGMKMVISGGAVVPPYPAKTEQPSASAIL
jgi:uncharacterized membrane protein